jgi:hypothetical protein
MLLHAAFMGLFTHAFRGSPRAKAPEHELGPAFQGGAQARRPTQTISVRGSWSSRFVLMFTYFVLDHFRACPDTKPRIFLSTMALFTHSTSSTDRRSFTIKLNIYPWLSLKADTVSTSANMHQKRPNRSMKWSPVSLTTLNLNRRPTLTVPK